MTAALRLEPYRREEHYRLLQEWWRARGDECLPADVLPETGSVAVSSRGPIAICSIWLTNSRMAHLAFPIAAPDIPLLEAYRAVEMVIQGSVEIAREAGYRAIWATAENRGVDRILTKRAGFVRASPINSYYLLIDKTVSPDILSD